MHFLIGVYDVHSEFKNYVRFDGRIEGEYNVPTEIIAHELWIAYV